MKKGNSIIEYYQQNLIGLIKQVDDMYLLKRLYDVLRITEVGKDDNRG